MKTVCDYHPTRPARWNCPKCQANYCSDCVTKRVQEQYGQQKTFHMCPKCNQLAKSLGVGNTIAPFWNRLPKFFTYPLNARPLTLIIVISLVRILSCKLCFFALLMPIIIWGILLKYSYAVLKNTARGDLSPPKLNSQTISDDFHQVFKQIGLFIMVGVVFFWLTKAAGIYIALLFLAFAILSVPAMIIILVTTNSFVAALNPMLFAGMAWRIGWGYLLMYFLLGLLGSAPAVLGQYVIQHLPAGLHLFLLSIAESFFTIASYNMMGYVIFQYHEEIGYEVDDVSDDLSTETGKSEHDASDGILNQVNILIKDGKIDNAISLIQYETEGVITELNLSERYYNLLKISQRTAEMIAHGKVHLDLLAEKNEKDKVCDIYTECISKDPQFTPGPSTLFKTASWLNETGNTSSAINAYNRFIKANAGSPLIPKAYFLASKLICEKLKKPKKAVGVLKGLIKAYPDHDITPYARDYLEKISLA
jgi:tetratricopeptide (TPR) repeat protein